jgi:hypothetical protein
MRKTVNMIFLAALLTLCLTAMAFAQTDKPAEKAKMVPKMSPDSAKAMMMKMSENYRALDEDIKKLDEHVKSMMNIEDMDSLRADMQKHMDMMKSMNMMMVEQNRMCRMMGAEGMSHMQKMEQMKRKTLEIKKPEKPEKEKKN